MPEYYCHECGTQLEIHDELHYSGRPTEQLQLYCPICKAGCGYVENPEVQ